MTLWVDQHKLNLNVKKCAIIKYGSRPSDKLFSISQQSLEVKSVEKDLGIHIDSMLKMDIDTAKNVHKASIALRSLKLSIKS